MMRSRGATVVPTLATVTLHALLLFVLTYNWTPQPERIIRPPPRHVMAKLVTVDKATVKKQTHAKPRPAPPKPEPPKPKPEPPKPKPEPEKPKPAPTKTTPTKAKPQPTKPAKPETKPEQKPDTRAQERARQAAAERELALSLADDERTQEAELGAEDAMAYEDAIQAVIEDNWSRPPSARRDMEVVLRIQLIPTGEVVSVSILKSSGNEAFDLAAVAAVNKAQRFPEVANAPPQLFEQYLRSFQLVFHPEDLRL